MRKYPTFLFMPVVGVTLSLFLALVPGLKAQTLTNTAPSVSATGTYQWENSSIWVDGSGQPAPVPDGAGTIVNLESDVATSGTVTITLGTTKTVGFLGIGDFNNNGFFVLAQQPSTSGTLVMDGGSTFAVLNNMLAQSTTSFPTISAPIQIKTGSDLVNGILDVNVGTNGNFMTILSGTITGGSIVKTGGGNLKITGTYTAAAGKGITVAMRGFGDAGTITNATQNSNLTLANTSGNSLVGNLTIGNASRGGTGSAVVTLGASNQIVDTGIIYFDGTSGNNPYFKLSGFSETVGGIQDTDSQGVIENSENEATSATAGFGTLTVNVASGTTYSYNGYIRDKNSVSTNGVNFAKSGAGTQILAGGNITYTGTTTISAGTLRLVNTINLGSTSITDNGTLELQNTSTTAWTFAKNVSGTGGLGLIGSTTATGGTITINVTGNMALGGLLNATQHLSSITAYNLTGTNSFSGFNFSAPITGIGATLTFGATTTANTETFGSAGAVISGPSAVVDFRTSASFTGGSMDVIRSDVFLQPNADGSLVMAGGRLTGSLSSIILEGNTLDTTFNILNDSSTNSRSSTDRVSDGTAWTSKGGKIVFGLVGSGAATSQSETLGTLSLVAGDLEISTSAVNSGQTSTLTFGGNLTSTRSVGATVNFSGTTGLGTAVNEVKFSGIASNLAFIAGWATAGTEWASYSTSTGVGVFSAYGSLPTTAGVTTTNVKMTGGGTAPTGATTINSLNLQAATAFTLTINSGSTLTISSGGILASGANHTISGGTLTSTAGEMDMWVPVSGQILTVNSVISGSNALIKAGLGSLVLGGVNTYTGRTYINQGTLQINADSGLGGVPALTADSIVFDGGELRFGGNFALSTNRGITIMGGGGTLRVANGQSITYDGVINGSAGVFTYNAADYTTTTNPGGTLTLRGVNDFSGGFETTSTVTTGTDTSKLVLTNNNTIGRIRIFGSNVTIGTNSNPLSSGATTTTITGDILMSGGNLVLAGNVNFNNANGTLITLIGGNFSLGSRDPTAGVNTNVANVTSTGPLVLNLTSGLFALGGNNLTINELNGSGSTELGNFYAGAATLTINQNSNTTFTGRIQDGTYLNGSSTLAAGALSITKTGTGNLTLSNSTNTFTGTVSILQGTLTVTDLSSFGSSSLGAVGFSTTAAKLVINGGALRYNGSTESFSGRSFTLGAGQDAGTIVADGTLRNAILHFGTLDTDTGDGLDGAVAFTGSGSRTLTLGGFNQGDNEFNLTLGDGTGGATSVAKTGNGTWLLTQANTYTGLTTVSGGVLAVTRDGALGSASSGTMLMGGPSIQSFSVGGVLDLRNVAYNTAETLFLDGGELAVTQGHSSWAGTVNVSVNSVIQVTGGDSLQLKGSLLGIGGITLVGQGTLTLSGDDTNRNASTAFMTVQAGTLVLDYGTSPNFSLTHKLSSTATLTLGGSRLGGTVILTGGTDALGVIEKVGSTSLQAGLNTISRTSGSSSELVLGSISVASGALLNVSADDIALTTTANKAGGNILGSWATVGGTDWAINSGTATPGGPTVPGTGTTTGNGGLIRALSSTAYVNDIWATNNNTTVTKDFSPAANSTTFSLRYNAPGSFSVNLSGNNVISTGGILITPNVGSNDVFLKGGTLSAGSGGSGTFPNQELVVYQNNTAGSFVISSAITNSTGSTGNGLNKVGNGTLILTGSNTYTGVTTLNNGIVSINSFGPTGFANNTGIASTTFFTNGVGNTLVYGSSVGLTIGQQVVAGSGVTAGATIVAIPDLFHYVLSSASTSAATSTITFTPTGSFGGALPGASTTAGSNIVTVTSMTGIVAGASVSGQGIPEGSYVAGIIDSTHYLLSTTATTTTSSPTTLTYGSNASGLGSATNQVANIVLNGGTLQYTGGTSFTDRGFTLNDSSTISVTNPNSTLTMTNVLQTAGNIGDFILTKSGDGTLAFTDATSGGYGFTGFVADGGRLQFYLGFGNDRIARNDVAALTSAGGAFELVGDILASRSQVLPGQYTLLAGTSEVKVTSQLGVTTTLTLQNSQDLLSVVRNPGATVRFVENPNLGAANIQLFNTIDLTGVPIPWAVYKDTSSNNDTAINSIPGYNDLALINASTGDIIAADSANVYVTAAPGGNVTNPAAWGSDVVATVGNRYYSEGSASFNGATANSDVNIQLLRYFNKGTSVVTITNKLTLLDGAIMIAANVGNNSKTITGGQITSGYGHGYSTNDLIIHNYNYSAPFTLASTIVDYTFTGSMSFGSTSTDHAAVTSTTVPNKSNITAFDVGETITSSVFASGSAKITKIDLTNGYIYFDQTATVSDTSQPQSFLVTKSVNLVATGQSVTKETNDVVLSNVATSGSPVLGSKTLTVTSTDGLVVGMQVNATGIPAGATITAIDTVAKTVTLSLAATSTPTPPTLTINFYLVAPVTSTFAGVGTTVLTGTNTYTGTTYVEGGVLRLDSAGAIPGGIGATGGTSHIIIDGGVIGLKAGDFNRALGTGVDQVEFTGSGGFAAYGFDRSVNFGGAGAALRWDYNNFLLGNSVLVLGAPDADHMVTVVNPINLGPLNRLVRVDNGTAAIDATLAGVLSSDGGGLVKYGFGTLALTGANTYTGGTVVAAGNLVAATPATAFGTGGIGLGTTSDSDVDDKVTLTLGAGTLPTGNSLTVGNANSQSITTIANTANVTVAGTVALEKKVFLNAATGNSMTFSNTISGAGGVTIIGGGDVVFSGSNTYGTAAGLTSGPGIDGGTVLRSGTLHLAAATAAGTTIIELGDATTVATKHVFLATNTTSISLYGGIFDSTHNGVAPNQGGPGAFVTVGNTVDGYTFTSADADSTPGNGTGKRILIKDEDGNPERNGVYRVVSVNATNNTMTLVRDTDFSTTANMVYGYQVIVDSGSSQNMAYFMAAPSVTTVNAGDTDPTAWQVDQVNPNVALVSDTTGLAIANKIDVNATNGTGTTSVGGSSTMTGTTTFSGAITLQNLLSGIAETKTLFLSSSTSSGDGVTFSGVISEADGSSDVLSIGRSGSATGVVTLSGANTYHGVTNVTIGALRVESDTGLGAADGSAATGTVVTSGAELQLSKLLSNLTIGNEALFLNGSGFTTAGGALHNITGDNIYGGVITQQSASKIAADTGSSLTLSNATSVAGNFGLTLGGTGKVTVSGTITIGANTLTKADAGTAVLVSANSYSGQTLITQGILQIQNNGALGTGDGTLATGTIVSSGGELDLAGTPSNLSISNEALFLNGSGSVGNGALRNVSGNNTYTGAVTLQSNASVGSDGGTLTLNSSTAISGTGNLTVAGSSTTTITSVINNTGNLNKIGTGTLILDNTVNNTYTGTTNVTGGVLQVGTTTGSVANTGTGAVTVTGTGTLAGTGTVRGVTTVGTGVSGGGGSISPGATGGTAVGTLTFSNGLTLKDFSSASFTVSGSASNADRINVTSGTGTFEIDHSAFTVAFNGYTPTQTDVINLMDWVGVLSASTTFNTGAPGGFRNGGTLGDLTLPDVFTLGLQYDVSQFLTDGTIRFALVPEPSRVLLLAAGLLSLTLRRRRRGAEGTM